MLTTSMLAGLALTTVANAIVLPRAANDTTSAGNLTQTTYYNGRGSDPDFTISSVQLESVLSCNGGLQNVSNPMLLVPGTWANATMAYLPGWNGFLSNLSYDLCYVAPPPYMTEDIQDTLEYIVYAIHRIYDVTGKKFPVMGHSQAGLAIQSALTYYPSIRSEVSQYISLAGSLRGTTAVPIVTEANLTTTLLDPAVWQQGSVSNWVKTLEQKGGNYNWIPTQTIFSTYDTTVMPQINASIAGSATYIAGNMSAGILVQAACPDLQTGHNEQLVSNFVYQVVKLALASSNKYATLSEVQQAVSNGTIDCSVRYAPTANLALYNQSVALVNGFASGQPRVIAQVHSEPLLRPYVAQTSDNPVHDA